MFCVAVSESVVASTDAGSVESFRPRCSAVWLASQSVLPPTRGRWRAGVIENCGEGEQSFWILNCRVRDCCPRLHRPRVGGCHDWSATASRCVNTPDTLSTDPASVEATTRQLSSAMSDRQTETHLPSTPLYTENPKNKTRSAVSDLTGIHFAFNLSANDSYVQRISQAFGELWLRPMPTKTAPKALCRPPKDCRVGSGCRLLPDHRFPWRDKRSS